MKNLTLLILCLSLGLSGCKKTRDITGPVIGSGGGTGGTGGGGTGGTGALSTPQITGLSSTKKECSAVGGGTSKICVMTMSLKTVRTVSGAKVPAFPTNVSLKASGGSVPEQVSSSAPDGLAVFTWSFGAGMIGDFTLNACVAGTKSCASFKTNLK